MKCIICNNELKKCCCYEVNNKELFTFLEWFNNKNNYYISLKDFQSKFNEVKVYMNSFLLNYFNNLDIVDTLKKSNEIFVSNGLVKNNEYFNNILNKIDPNIDLDIEQRKVILCEDDYTLVVAGAGSGKTTTLCAKVKYLVDKLNIKEEEILLISYTNKAVDELKERINMKLNINCSIQTFHSLGYRLLTQNNNELNIFSDLYSFVSSYLYNEVLTDSSLANELITFFSYYLKDFNVNMSSLKLDLKQTDSEHTYSLGLEYFNNYELCMIANFLYLNSINYVYEFNSFVLIDYNIILLYKRSAKTKQTIVLINNLDFDRLSTVLTELNVLLIPRKSSSIYKQIVDKKNKKYLHKLSVLITRFITNFKSNAFTSFDFEVNDLRSITFLKFTKIIYDAYMKYLKERNSVDFEDMINLSVNYITNLNYKYLIIDEYQDISTQRFNLIKKLSEKCNSKVIVVGDDFQSIYSFSGSNVNLFLKFIQDFGYGTRLFISRTYRNSIDLIGIAGKFIMKNDKQIKKELISSKTLNKPITIIPYDDSVDFNTNHNKAKALYEVILDIVNKSGVKTKILLIGRYHFDLNFVLSSSLFSNVNNKLSIITKNCSIDFLTAHQAKGLTYDEVIIINASNELFGFPSLIENDPVINLVKTTEDNYLHSEERRLWYGAQRFFETYGG